MSTTNYTSLLGLALPTQGDLSGQWGNEVNNYITTYLDSAIAGQLAISLTGNLTLTKATGTSLSSTSSQYAILNVTPSASTWTITVPAASQIYHINNLSSTHTFTIKASGQTGFVVAAAEKCVVAYNGTDFVRVGSTSVFGAPSTALRLDTSGNLGLGVTPSAWAANFNAIQIASSGVSLFSDDAEAGWFANNAYWATGPTPKYLSSTYAAAYRMQRTTGQHQWYIAPSGTAGNTITFTQAMTLDASGNLGLGVTPSAWGSGKKVLQIGTDLALFYNAANDSAMTVNAYNNGTNNIYLTSNYATNYRQNVGQHIWYNAPSGTAGNAITFTQAMTLDASGNLLVGTTTAYAKTVSISSDGVLAGVIGINDFSGVSCVDSWNRATSGNNTFSVFGTEVSFTTRGSITYNRAGGLVVYNTTSDYRAKDIIGPVQDSGATIDALKVYEGQMKDATQSRPMLIAHEAQAVTPYAVTGEKDAVKKDGTPDYQQMDVSSLVPLLVAEIQSLRIRISQLEAK
jgi:hypothetical protein